MKTLSKMVDEVLRISLMNVKRDGYAYAVKTKADYENETFEFLSNTKAVRELYGITDGMIMDLIKYCMSNSKLSVGPCYYEGVMYYKGRNAYPLILAYCLTTIRQNKLDLDNDDLINWVSALSNTSLNTEIYSHHSYEHPFDSLDVYDMKEELKSALDMRQFISDNFKNIGVSKSGIINSIDDMYKAYHLWDEKKDDFCLFEEVVNHSGFKHDNGNRLYAFDFTSDGNILFKYILPVTK